MVKLTLEQIETTINNLAKIRHFGKIEKIYDNKPIYNNDTITKAKQILPPGFEIIKGRIADNYKIYLFSNVLEDERKEILNYNIDCKFPNLRERKEIIIIVNSEKFDKQNYNVISILYPLFHSYIEDDNITIMSTVKTTESINNFYNTTKILPHDYKIFSICDIYPLIGSKTTKFSGFTYDYELLEFQELYNKNKYSSIFENDPVVKILNGKINQLIIAKKILFEKSPYEEFAVRQIKTILNENNSD